jgi:hypothetical protein
MPIAALPLLLLMSAAGEQEPPITVKGYPWAPFISPMGEPFRPVSSGEAPIAAWFAGADANRDGFLTAAELQGDADRFFTRLDDNQDGQVDREELVMYESVIAPEIQVNSNWRHARGETPAAVQPPAKDARDRRKGRDDEYDGYHLDGLQGAARYGLLNIPQPVASADADFNRAVSRIEFRQAAAYRFTLLDRAGSGRISLSDLQERLPARPKGKRSKPPKDATDARIGNPLPKE